MELAFFWREPKDIFLTEFNKFCELESRLFNGATAVN
jgi:hypothetical protein